MGDIRVSYSCVNKPGRTSGSRRFRHFTAQAQLQISSERFRRTLGTILSSSVLRQRPSDDGFSALVADRFCSLYRFLLSPVGRPFPTAHFPGHGFRLTPASGSFASPAFPVPPLHHHWVPSDKAAARLGSRNPRFWVPQEMGQKKETFLCPTYMLSGIALAWFVRQRFSH
jgi:hypothetical protein